MNCQIERKNPGNSTVYCPRPGCQIESGSPASRQLALKNGFYYRSSDRKRIRRYRCGSCKRSFSRATGDPHFGQRKRQVNEMVMQLLTSHVSMRRTAKLLGIHRSTVAVKKVFLAIQSIPEQRMMLEDYVRKNGKFTKLQFDDLETIEHTKCKPVAVPLIVDAKTRLILGIGACSMPAKGLLAEFSRRKYGPRPCHRKKTWNALFLEVAPFIAPNAQFKSDSHPFYPELLKQVFPDARHDQVISRKGRSGGQGELKKGYFDTIFSLNHTCAMLRANICRLIRKTWCTSKRIDRLLAHLQLYIVSHNREILRNLAAAQAV